MMIYSALWFPKLETLLDADEALPTIAAREMTERFLQRELIKSNPSFALQMKIPAAEMLKMAVS